MKHEWGNFYFCKRCGCRMDDWYDRREPKECPAPLNQISMANEHALEVFEQALGCTTEEFLEKCLTHPQHQGEGDE